MLDHTIDQRIQTDETIYPNRTRVVKLLLDILPQVKLVNHDMITYEQLVHVANNLLHQCDEDTDIQCLIFNTSDETLANLLQQARDIEDKREAQKQAIRATYGQHIPTKKFQP